MSKQGADETTFSFKIKITALGFLFAGIFSIGMLYSNYLDLDRHVKALEAREEVACQKVNDMYVALSKISENINWIKEALKAKKESK